MAKILVPTNDVADGNFAHAFVVVIPRVVGLALRRPQVAARNLVAVRPVLVDPPVAQDLGWIVSRQGRRFFRRGRLRWGAFCRKLSHPR